MLCYTGPIRPILGKEKPATGAGEGVSMDDKKAIRELRIMNAIAFVAYLAFIGLLLSLFFAAVCPPPVNY